MDIETNKSYVAHDRLLRMWLCVVQLPTRSVTHELRIGAGRSIVTCREAVQERVVRQIRMLRAMRRELETGLRCLLHGHAGGNPGHGQGATYGLPRQFPTLPGGVDRADRQGLGVADLVGVVSAGTPTRPPPPARR